MSLPENDATCALWSLLVLQKESLEEKILLVHFGSFWFCEIRVNKKIILLTCALWSLLVLQKQSQQENISACALWSLLSLQEQSQQEKNNSA